jgi:hypothetical protein
LQEIRRKKAVAMVVVLLVVELSDGKYDGDEESGKLPKRAGNTGQLQPPTTTVAADCGKPRRTRRPSAGNGAPDRKTESNFLFFIFFLFG